MNVDSKTVCHKLLIKGLIVLIRLLWILSIDINMFLFFLSKVAMGYYFVYLLKV